MSDSPPYAVPETPGWYPDPSDLSQHRYFDGRRWTLETTERDAGLPPFARFGARSLAACIDLAVQAALAGVLLIVPVVGLTLSSGTSQRWWLFACVVVTLSTGLAYAMIFEGGPYCMTPGKRAVSLQVRDADGNLELGRWRAAKRWLMRLVSGPVTLVDHGWMLTDDQSRTWHDMAADTRVVQINASERPALGELVRGSLLRR